jgi:hypothetical protein
MEVSKNCSFCLKPSSEEVTLTAIREKGKWWAGNSSQDLLTEAYLRVLGIKLLSGNLIMFCIFENYQLKFVTYGSFINRTYDCME